MDHICSEGGLNTAAELMCATMTAPRPKVCVVSRYAPGLPPLASVVLVTVAGGAVSTMIVDVHVPPNVPSKYLWVWARADPAMSATASRAPAPDLRAREARLARGAGRAAVVGTNERRGRKDIGLTSLLW